MSEILQPLIVKDVPQQLLPDPDDISYYVLENDRKIYLDYDVDESLMTLQRMILRWNMEDKNMQVEDRKPIIIYIMSYGGSLDYMWMMIDAINASKTPVYTVNLGKAASAASLIFISGSKRFMTKNSKIIIHEGSASFEGDAIKIMDANEGYKRELKKMKSYILEHTRISKSVLMKKRSNDWELDAQYCLDNGVCEKIIETLDEII